MKQLDLQTKATADDIERAWTLTFQRPSLLASMFSPSRKIARGCRWQPTSVAEATSAMELTAQNDLGNQMLASHAGSNSGSVIAMTRREENGTRHITVWSPVYKQGTFGTNQFAKTFKIFARSFEKQIKTLDPGSRRI